MAWMAVPLNFFFFSVLFLGLVIFPSPLFPDEVGHHAEFQRSPDLLLEFGIVFPPV